jgi:transposase InsO family protein
MSKRRLVITAVVLEGREVAEVAATYGASRSWVYELVALYRAEGEAAFEPRSKRPHSSPTAIPAALVDAIVAQRLRLEKAGLDAGPETIAWHLAQAGITAAPTTIWRTLVREGLVTPQPRKRPRSSYRRFQAELPNEMWQTDFTHWPLANGEDVEILTFIDDHSRLITASRAHHTITGKIVVAEFTKAVETYGLPVAVLSDNGLVFTARFVGGINAFETHLAAHGITKINSTPWHPQTCGKVERWQQTLKRFLTGQPPASSLRQLQQQIDTFVDEYNHRRPHRSHGKRTPAAVYQSRPKASPDNQPDSIERIRHDRVDALGKLTLRRAGKLHHIGLGVSHAHTPVLMLIQDLHIRVVNQITGELLRELVLDPTRDYQATGRRKRRKP